MKTCTFFGHRDAPESIYGKLEQEIINLIENEKVDRFLVGNKGLYDSMVRNTLENLSQKYNFTYYVVLAYLPKDNLCPENSIMPTGFEKFPPKFAIDKRNEYMLNKSDFVICYVTHHFGGAGKFMEKAIKKNKKVINIADK